MKVEIFRSIPAGRTHANFDGPLVGYYHREYDGRALLRAIPGKNPGEMLEPTINLSGFRAIGQATGTQLQRNFGLKNVFVMRDYRPDAENVQDAVMKGLLRSGANVLDLGMGVTPAALYAYYHLTLQTKEKWGGVMISASHNPNGWAGTKIIHGPSMTFGPLELQENEKVLREGNYLSGEGTYREYSGVNGSYLSDLASRPLQPKKPLKIVTSTFHGGAGLFLPAALRNAGHDVIEVFSDLDWSFPDGNPNPENRDNLEAVGKKVRELKADLGMMADGDGDRFGVVDENGKEIYADRAAMVIMDGILDQMTDPRIVIDLKSTGAWDRWQKFIDAGGKTVVVPTGHFYTKFGAKKLGLPHWFERSGHFGLGAPYGYSFDDANLAALAFAYAVSNAGKPASEILSKFPKSYQSPNMQPMTTDEQKYNIIGEVVTNMRQDQANGVTVCGKRIKKVITMDEFADFATALKMPGPEGFGGRIVLEDGSWGLLRASANQPVFVVISESFGTEDDMKGIAMYLNSKLEPYGIKAGSKQEGGSYDQFINDWKNVKWQS